MEAEILKLIKAAKSSCKALLSLDKTAATAPMLKWVDVVDALVAGDHDLVKKDLEVIMMEPLKIVSDACVSRLKDLGRELNDASTAADKHRLAMVGNVFERRKAHVDYVNELFSMLEAITGDKYPRVNHD